MPTYETTRRFERDYQRLTEQQRRAFREAVRGFVADLETGRGFRKGLRVKRVQGTAGVFQMTWAPDGRATFEYGVSARPGEPHIVWRRCGTHDVFREP